MWNLENGEFLSLFLYGEGGVRVEDDGGAGGLRVELPLLGDPRRLRPWSRADGEGGDKMFYLNVSRLGILRGWQPGFSAAPRHEM